MLKQGVSHKSKEVFMLGEFHDAPPQIKAALQSAKNNGAWFKILESLVSEYGRLDSFEMAVIMRAYFGTIAPFTPDRGTAYVSQREACFPFKKNSESADLCCSP